MKVIRYKDAKRLGLKRYFTGKPCPNGHIAERYTGKRSCTACNLASYATWAARNGGRRSEYWQGFYAENRDVLLARGVVWRAANPQCGRKKSAKRRARKANATPPWLTPADHAAIAAVYDEAVRLERETGVKHHVDHIVPLHGRGVCGLHVPWNLRAIPANDNLKKSNRLLA